MNYYGRVLDDRFCGDFLKDALYHVPYNAPYRGLKIYQNGSYTYVNETIGEFSFFSGKEQIYYEDDKVYECIYHGGILK